MVVAAMPSIPIPTVADLIALLPLLGLGLLTFLASLVLIIAHRLAHPPRRTYAWAVSKNVPGDPGELDAPLRFGARTLEEIGRGAPVWEIEGEAADGPVVVLTHGWGESRIHGLVRAQAAVRVASRVVAWDMPGHGEHAGPTSLGAIEAGALAGLVDAVRTDRGVVLWGWSLGAEVSLRAAAALKRRGAAIEGLVLESPFRRGLTPARAVMRAAGFPAGLPLTAALALIGLRRGRPADRFRDLAETAADLRGVRGLIVHGDADAVCPAADGEAIAAALGAAFVLRAGAGHSDLWSDAHRDETAAAVRAFLTRSG